MKQNQMGDLIKQVSRMRKDMDKVNEELKERYVEASAGGCVEVVFNGQQELARISIDVNELEKDEDGDIDFEILEDMIVVAVNQGIEKSKEMMNEELNDATGGLAGGIPGLF